MCGIVGQYDPKRRQSKAHLTDTLIQMSQTLTHRGPDDHGTWSSESNDIGLAFRRLAIIDLTRNGHQPMLSRSGKSAIVFNGEIYNHKQIQKEIGINVSEFRGNSDTEVLLEACELWGVEKTLSILNGMFAFAYWDSRTENLWLARDRFGIKPLYWTIQNGIFLFSSELRAFHKNSFFTAELNTESLHSYIRHGYFPEPASAYNNTFKIPPGQFVKIDSELNPSFYEYYDAESKIIENKNKNNQISFEEACVQTETAIDNAVSKRMVADVPVGAFLSGGIDSSIVALSMQRQSAEPINTFSIGFNNRNYDEANIAKEIANHIGTNHTEVYVDDTDALDLVTHLSEVYDEPFGDSSQIPTLLVCKHAKEIVTVALSGDGGDEVFAGYNRYIHGVSFSKTIRKIPSPIRHLAQRALQIPTPNQWNRLSTLFPQRYRTSAFGDKLYKFSDVLCADEYGFYERLTSAWPTPETLINPHIQNTTNSANFYQSKELSFIENMQLNDLQVYLPNDILAKVDRASMHHSLEVRVPLLDYELLEFSASLPMQYKLHNGKTKIVLRELLKTRLPDGLFDRPKMGFGVPMDQWLRGPLREWAEELLCEDRLNQSGLYNVSNVRKCWIEHQEKSRNWQYVLWNILMLEEWRRKWPC